MATWIRNESDGNVLFDLASSSKAGAKTIGKSDVLFQEGAAVRHLYLVLSGSFKLVRHSSEGKELIVDLVGTGEVLGSFIEPSESAALARALEDSVVYPFPASMIRSELERSPALATELVRRAETKRLAAEAHAARLAFDSVSRRLASFLLEIGDRKTGLLRFPLSQGEIAGRIGSSRETVCSLLNGLRRSGLIEIGRGRIRVLDRDGLAGVG